MTLAVRSTPGVVGTAIVSPSPFSQSNETRGYDRQGRRVEYSTARASDDLPAVLGSTVTRGRFFSREDDAATWEPVVVTSASRGSSSGTTTPWARTSRATGTPRASRRSSGAWWA